MLKIEYVPVKDLKPYEHNAKLHPAEQVEQIKKSIKDYGFNDPIAVWNDTIVEGHGRLLAAQALKLKKVPVIRLDDLTDEQRREYMLVHNKTTMNSDFNIDLLDLELGSLMGFDKGFYGFASEDVITPDEIEGGGIEDRSKAKIAVKIVFETAEKWRHHEDIVREFIDGIDGATVSVGEYEDQ